MKTSALCAALAFFALSGSSVAAETAAAPPVDPVRDERWLAILKLYKTYPETDHTVDRRQNSIERDRIWRTLREKGLEFWDAYPQDPRRFHWLCAMENRGLVANFKGIGVEFDPDELRTWRARRPALRAELMTSPEVTPDQWVQFRHSELRFDVLFVTGICRFGADLDPDPSSRLTLESVVADILEFADTHPAPEQCTNPRVKVGRHPVDLMHLLLATHLHGDTPESKRTLAGIVPRMRASRLEPMRRYGNDLAATVSDQKLALTGRTLTGESFDLDSYRGKLVLLDCWATWCAPCIREMPELRRLEEHFGPQGFAVVGLSLDTAATRDKVLGVLKSTRATWPQVAEANELARSLGCRSVPYALLVGRDGRVIAAGSFRLVELEKLIRDHSSL